MTLSPLGAASQAAEPECGVCRLHEHAESITRFEIRRLGDWLLRHHPHPAPLSGWLLLDTLRHTAGPVSFSPGEAAGFGPMLQRCSVLVQELTGCERVYVIAFGEGARHLHLHLIPRHAADPATEAWRAADLYRLVSSGERSPAPAQEVEALVRRARERTSGWR